jgi:hypothetical protein
LLLDFASTANLGFVSHGTHDLILLPNSSGSLKPSLLEADFASDVTCTEGYLTHDNSHIKVIFSLKLAVSLSIFMKKMYVLWGPVR